MNDVDVQRLATATNALRPDWPTRSIATFLTRNLAGRPLHDAARIIVWIATEPGQTPGTYRNDTPRLATEDGPWTAALIARATDEPTPTPVGWCTLHRCEDSTARPCQMCRQDRAQAVTDPEQITNAIAAVRANIRPTTNALRPPEPATTEPEGTADADA